MKYLLLFNNTTTNGNICCIFQLPNCKSKHIHPRPGHYNVPLFSGFLNCFRRHSNTFISNPRISNLHSHLIIMLHTLHLTINMRGSKIHLPLVLTENVIRNPRRRIELCPSVLKVTSVLSPQITVSICIYNGVVNNLPILAQYMTNLGSIPGSTRGTNDVIAHFVLNSDMYKLQDDGLLLMQYQRQEYLTCILTRRI